MLTSFSFLVARQPPSSVARHRRVASPPPRSGELVLVNFIFTGCGTSCPSQTAALAEFDRSQPPMLRDKVAILPISVHADSPDRALDQLAMLALPSGAPIDRGDLAAHIARLIDVVVQIERKPRGRGVVAVRWAHGPALRDQ